MRFVRWLQWSAVTLVLALAIGATACTGDDDATTTSTATAGGDTASSATTDETTTTAAAPTTTTTPPPPVVEPIPIDVEEDLGYASAVALLPPQASRGHVLIGTEAQEGQSSRPVLWESGDGLTWVESSAPAPPDDQTVLGVGDATYVGTALAVGGSTNAGDGPRPAVWLATDGRTFDAPHELPLGERTGGISAMAASDAGLVVTGWIEDDEGDTAFVAVRAPDGTWRHSAMPELPEFAPSEVAVAGPTVVVTGTDNSAQPAQAQAVVSTDGATSFQVSDTSGFAAGVSSHFGPVAVTPTGFVAVACASTATGQRTALARSVDGFAWSRQDITVIGDPQATARLTVQSAGCSSLHADGDAVHVGVVDIGSGWVLTVRPDGSAEGREIARRPGSMAADPPLVVRTMVGLTVVSRDTTGLTPSTLSFLPSDVGDALGQGLPGSGPALERLDLTPLTGGVALQVTLYPRVEERSGGVYAFSPFGSWLESGDGRSFTPSASAIPEAVSVIHSTPFGELGLGLASDPTDHPDGTGPIGAHEGFLRGSDGAWQSVGLIAAGSGGEVIADMTSVDGGAVGVGRASLRDPATNETVTVPLVRASVDGVTWWEELVALTPGAIGGLTSACTLGEQVFGYGWRILDGIESRIVAVRDPAGAWTVAAPSGIPGSTGLGGCETNGTSIVIVGSGLDRSAVWSSTDGINFTQADLSAEAFTNTAIRNLEPGGGGFVAIGTKRGPDFEADGAIWTSPDGLTWTEVPVAGLQGRGGQVPSDVAVAPDGSLTIVGTDTGAVVAWNVPAEAWSP